MSGSHEEPRSMSAQGATAPTGTVQEKECKVCKIVKPLDSFYVALTCKDGHRGDCKKCHMQKGSLRDRREYGKRYRTINKEREATRSADWVRDNHERYRNYQNNWRKENPEKARAYCKKWNDGNQGARREYYRNYAINNPSKRADIKRRKRARKRTVTIERFTSLEIFERDRWICQICKKKVLKTKRYPDPYSASMDHIIPLSAGGTHERKNVQLAHFVCNTNLRAGGIKQLRLL